MSVQLTVFDLMNASRRPDVVEFWKHDHWHPDGGEWVEVSVTCRDHDGVEGTFLDVTRWPGGTGSLSEVRRISLNYRYRGTAWRETQAVTPPMHGRRTWQAGNEEEAA